MATGCGYTYPAIDAMTLDQAQEIFEGWRTSPPAHHMMQILAMAWGWKPPRTARAAPRGAGRNEPLPPLPGGGNATVPPSALRGMLAGMAPTMTELKRRDG